MTDLHITGPNGDGEYWLHIKAGGKMGGINLGVAHGPLVRRLLDAAAIEAPVQEPVAWRYRWKIDGEYVGWRFSDHSNAHPLLDGFEEVPLYATPPDALTRLSHALAAETAKREAMEAALRYYADQFCEGFCDDMPSLEYTDADCERDCGGCKARATLAKHGSKT